MIILRNKLYSWADKILAEEEGISVRDVRRRRGYGYFKNASAVDSAIYLRDREARRTGLNINSDLLDVYKKYKNVTPDMPTVSNKRYRGYIKRQATGTSFDDVCDNETKNRKRKDAALSKLEERKAKEAAERAAKEEAERIAKKNAEEAARKGKGLVNLIKTHPIPAIVGGTALAGGGIYLYHRHKKKGSEKQDKK